MTATTNLQIRTSPDLADRFKAEAQRRRLPYGELLALLLDGEHAGGMPEHGAEHAPADLAPRVAELERLVGELLARVDRLPAGAAAAVERRSAERRAPPRAAAVADDTERTEPPGAAALRAWKEREGLTVTTMAARLGMPRGTVGGWLKGILPAPAARPTVEAVTGIPAAAWERP